MKRWRIFGRFAAAAGALLLMAATPNWNATVAQTPGGGYRVGNPAAKVKLIEFISYSCPHCAAFHREGDLAMRIAYVAPGKMSVEVRPLLRNVIDLTALMMTACGPKEKFFLNHAAILKNQDKWLEKLEKASQVQRNRWDSGTPAARRRAIAGDLGFYELMQPRGYDRVTLDRCLSDDARAKRLAALSEAGSKEYEVEATPSFVLDGTLLAGTHSWEDLQPQLAVRM